MLTTRVNSTALPSTSASASNCPMYAMNSPPNPTSPRPTTHMPITAPPRNATARAGDRPVRAAAAVRTFARVATRMPKNPASPEQPAPAMNDRPTSGDDDAASEVNASRPAMMSTKIARTLYSAARKAIAPRKICAAMFCMRTLPGSCLVIQAAVNRAYNSARAPQAGTA
jgi:hypothetical protein